MPQTCKAAGQSHISYPTNPYCKPFSRNFRPVRNRRRYNRRGARGATRGAPLPLVCIYAGRGVFLASFWCRFGALGAVFSASIVSFLVCARGRAVGCVCAGRDGFCSGLGARAVRGARARGGHGRGVDTGAGGARGAGGAGQPTRGGSNGGRCNRGQLFRAPS